LPEKKKNLINFCINKSLEYKKALRTLKNEDVSAFYPDWLKKTVAAVCVMKYAGLHFLADKIIYSKLRNGISSNFVLGISGGGAFQNYLDEFFDAIGILVFNGYGMTEASPIISIRTPENGILGSVGVPLSDTKIKLIDPETKKYVKSFKKGILCVKGPQVMRGNYKNPEATKEALTPDGWLITGDLVKIAPNGSIIITGRAKDTIVLSNGENIEPQGIEDACLKSPFIKQIMLVGQDRPALGALIVPDYDNLKAQGVADDAVQKFIQQEVKNLVKNRENYMNFERISSIRVVNEGFSVENGLMTQTVKIRRNKVFEKYSNVIEEMFL